MVRFTVNVRACTKVSLPFARGEMAGVCVECWLHLDCIVQPNLLRNPEDTTFQKLFETSVLPKLSDENKEGVLTSLDVSVSESGRGMWKKVCVDDDIGLSLAFGCRYIQFKITNDQDKPPAMCAPPKRSSTFKALMDIAAKRDCLSVPSITVTSKDMTYSMIFLVFSRYVYIYVYNDNNYSNSLLNLAGDLHVVCTLSTYISAT